MKKGGGGNFQGRSYAFQHFGSGERFGKDIAAVNGGSNKNMDKAESYSASLNITQYWTRPYTPKEKPYAERPIGTHQKKCLGCNYTPLNVTELRGVTGAWIDKYRLFRPHESLGFLTPAEYCARLGVSIPHSAGAS